MRAARLAKIICGGIAADSAAWKENGAVVLVALLGSPFARRNGFPAGQCHRWLGSLGTRGECLSRPRHASSCGRCSFGSVRHGSLRRADRAMGDCGEPRVPGFGHASHAPRANRNGSATNAALHFGGLTKDKRRAEKNEGVPRTRPLAQLPEIRFRRGETGPPREEETAGVHRARSMPRNAAFGSIRR
jgi:hypothetical protein